MRTLVEPGFALEPLVAAHAGEMFAVLTDPAIYEFENTPPPSEAWLQARYERLEQRGPADASEIWLNWVIRLDHGELAGYVQATVLHGDEALIAYELNSRHWRRGIGRRAVTAMLTELRDGYGVREVLAVLKTANFRSMGLLHQLGFVPASEAACLRHRDEADETVLTRPLSGANPGA
jgi:RimJ/RimL family protein N-acetyltransferase